MHILREPLIYYDKTYYCTLNRHQDKLQDLNN